MNKNFENYGAKEIILQQIEEEEKDQCIEYYKSKGFIFENIHDTLPCEDGNLLTLKFTKEKFLKCSYKNSFKI